ncbi:MAG: hypothetical protein WB564_02210 [Dehalococcoidia bacterium]
MKWVAKWPGFCSVWISNLRKLASNKPADKSTIWLFARNRTGGEQCSDYLDIAL